MTETAVERTVRTVCPHDCPDMCSMLVSVRDGRVLRVQGDPDHPVTRGFLCGKVMRYAERVHSPDRLLTPLRRTGPKGVGAFEPIAWDTALDEIATRWRTVMDESGSEALLGWCYSGNQGVIGRNLFQALFHALGASRFIAGTICDSACDQGWEYAVGHNAGSDMESVADSDLVICWGANVVTTNVHIVPLINEARAKGAPLVVIDPYRTRTARHADWHIAPHIGSDTALALGVMHVLVRDGLYDAEFVARRTVGFERLCLETLPYYTPRAVERICGVPAADVERLARMYGGAKAPFIRLGMGMSRHSGGGMAVRTVACLPALVGAWAKPGGGALLASASGWELEYNALRRPDLAPRPTRRINHSLLGSALLELNDPPIRALFVASNNPAVTCPDSARVLAGLQRDDLFTVVHDTFMSDTARYADIVLPASTSLESEDFYRSYGHRYAQYAPRVIEPLGEARSNLWLIQQLAGRFGLDDDVFTRTPREHLEQLFAGARGAAAGIAPGEIVANGPTKLPLANPGPAITYLYSEQMEADGLPGLPEWRPDPAAPQGEDTVRWPLRLLTAPGHHQHHTAFAGVASLERKQGVPACLLHPEDAAARGIRDGDAVKLFNARGYVGLVAKVTADGQLGVAVVEGSRSRARFLAGGPLNVLTSDHLSDMGAGATYQSTWVEASLLTEAPRG